MTKNNHKETENDCYTETSKDIQNEHNEAQNEVKQFQRHKPTTKCCKTSSVGGRMTF